MAQARDCGRSSRGGGMAGAHRGPGVYTGTLHRVHGKAAVQAAAHGAQPRARGASATLCGPVWMAGTCRGHGAGVVAAFFRRAPRLRHLRAELWPSGSDRFFRATLWNAARDQRAPDLLDLGTARLLRKLPDRARRQQGKAGAAFPACRICGAIGESLRAGELHPGFYLQGKKVRLSDRALATVKEMGLAIVRMWRVLTN